MPKDSYAPCAQSASITLSLPANDISSGSYAPTLGTTTGVARIKDLPKTSRLLAKRLSRTLAVPIFKFDDAIA